MTNRLLLRSTIALVALGTLAACGSDSKSAATTAAAATTARPATTAAAATTAPATTAIATTTAAGGGGDYDVPNSVPATSAAAPASATSLALHTDPTLGPILVDSEGFTLYLFTKDTGTTSVCLDKCAQAWPPAVATGTPTAGPGLDASKLTASPQPDGTSQLTYNGHLLYRYAPDQAPGDTTGQDVGEVWYVVNAAGDQVG